MFCKHKWSILSETTTESKMEQVNKTGADFKITNLLMFEMLQKKHICILQCEKCGKLKRFVEEI